ncbi:MAG: hypothetical protein HQK97_09290 [Nitrospirae bacterium]|nr:hypothetical protein [Nitrospirota bacterium]
MIDLTESLLCLGNQYIRFLISINDCRDLKLYIKEIKAGSIIAVLMEYSPYVLPVLPVIPNAVALIDFSRYIKKVFDYFTGRAKEKIALDKTDYNNFNKIINPVAKDSASQMIFHDDGDVHVHINSLEANAIQNAIARELQQLKEPEHKIYQKVFLRMYQARNEPSTVVGDRAIIESISVKPLKIIFAYDEMKLDIIQDTKNLFRLISVVDVSVETIQEIPVAYKILHIHEKFENPPYLMINTWNIAS